MQASTADPRRRVLRIIAVVVLGAALAMTAVSCGAETAVESGVTPATQLAAANPTGNLGGALGATPPDSHAPSTDALPPAIVVDSPISGATVQNPVRVTGTVAGGATVNVSLQIVTDDESVVANWAEQFYDTGVRLTFDQSLPYAPSFAGRAARIVITLSVLPTGGQPATYVNVVPITLQ